MYYLNTLIRFALGIVSITTVFYLVKVLPEAFKQKNNLELEIGIGRRKVAEKKLSEAYKGLQAFAYVASHHLEEPLRKIRTYTSLLQNANANIFDAKSIRYSNKVVTAGTKM